MTEFVRKLISNRSGATGLVTLPAEAFEGTAFEGADTIRYTGLQDGVAISPGGDVALTKDVDQWRFGVPAARVAEMGVIPGVDDVEIEVKEFGMRLRPIRD